MYIPWRGLYQLNSWNINVLKSFTVKTKTWGGGGGVSTPLLVIIAGHMTSDQLESAKSVH